MAWDPDDVARSVRRYAALTLSDDWTLRVERREVTDDDRPVWVLDTGDLTALSGRTSLEQGNVENLLPVTLNAYPVVAANERLARAGADAVRAQLYRLIANGVEVLGADGRRKSAPFMVPLWDYAGVPLEGEDRAGPEFPVDVMEVQRESLAARKIQDPDDSRRFTVVCEFRLVIESPGSTVPGELVDGFQSADGTTEGYRLPA